MSETRLLIDLGNSRVKWMWVRGRTIDPERAGRGDLDALASACRAPGAKRPDAVLIASVAGAALTGEVEQLALESWGMPVRTFESQPEQGGVRNAYAEPTRLGVDRWLAIVGAVQTYGVPVVVWDLGTAATLDAVDAEGRHLGGWIVPGPLRNAGTIEPGTSTSECIARGAAAAQAGALREMLADLERRGVPDPRVVVTGGDASALLPSIGLAHVHDPWLVFRGMLVE